MLNLNAKCEHLTAGGQTMANLVETVVPIELKDVKKGTQVNCLSRQSCTGKCPNPERRRVIQLFGSSPLNTSGSVDNPVILIE